MRNVMEATWTIVLVLLAAATAYGADERLAADKPKKPHLILFLADDFGWANVGFHRLDSTKEVQTPNIDALASAGVIFDQFYTYKICSPSRSSLQSGRNPMHVNTVNTAPEVHNSENTVSGYAGIPPNMTCLADKMKAEGYRTVMTGKWDVGMATWRQTPRGRGYEKFLGYFHHANDYNDCGVGITALGEINVCLNKFTDLWKDDGPAIGLAGTAYEEEIFENHTIQAIQAHDPKSPLFLFHAFHIVHTPLQVPDAYLEMFSFIDFKRRRQYAAMVFYMDRTIGRIVNALKAKSMYEDSIILFFSDNGGPVYNPGSANNYPLRGGKYSDFQGGVRVNAFASGGRIPSSKRGTISQAFVHVSDVYASFVRLAHFGTDGDVSSAQLAPLLVDHEAESVGLPPVDSMDTLWPAIKGASAVRTEIHLSSQALISGRYKIIVGAQTQDMWQGPYYPNATGQEPIFPDADVTNRFHSDCGPAGCLFDIFADPTEQNDLGLLPQIKKELLDRLTELNKSEFKPDRGSPSMKACLFASTKWKGHYGPFVGVKLFSEPSSSSENLVEIGHELPIA